MSIAVVGQAETSAPFHPSSSIYRHSARRVERCLEAPSAPRCLGAPEVENSRRSGARGSSGGAGERSGQQSRSLSDLGSVGCNLAAAVHFSPRSCPIAMAMGLRTRQKLSSLGPNFASTPQVRQAPRRARCLKAARGQRRQMAGSSHRKPPRDNLLRDTLLTLITPDSMKTAPVKARILGAEHE